MKIILSLFILGYCFACTKQELIKPYGIEVLRESDSIVFAVIGDYGYDGKPENKVADMVKSWNPDFILTTGDNNYQKGNFSTLNNNIGKYYADYIYNFDASGVYKCKGRASEEEINRFFPSPGNHDTYSSSGLTPYLNYFTLPGNELFYHFNWGPVSFYALNSTERDMNEQFAWLEENLAKDSANFQVVYFHHSPYSPGPHGNEDKMQWDYQAHGVELVMTGHDHIYARIEKKDEEGFYYLITGAGGKSLYNASSNPLDSALFSVVSYDLNYGAIQCKATTNQLVVEYYSIGTEANAVDRIVIQRANQ
ncbi:MAG: metallophosphoesterase [Prolixibacteraceae bacterium]